MRFRAEHHFAASPAAVAGLLVDPDFVVGVDLPDLARPEVVEHAFDDGVATLRLRYEYVGQLDPIAKRLVGGRRLTWLQDLYLDVRSGRGELTVAAEAAPETLRGRATVVIAADGAGSVRTVEGELTVRVPVVGGTAERRIVPGLLRRLDVEAEAIVARLRGSGA